MLAMLDSRSRVWLTKLIGVVVVEGAIVELEAIEVEAKADIEEAKVEAEADIEEAIAGIVVESDLLWYRENSVISGIYQWMEKSKEGNLWRTRYERKERKEGIFLYENWIKLLD